MTIVEYTYGKYFFEPIGTEKGKLIERWGRKVAGLRYWKILWWLDCLEYDTYPGGRMLTEQNVKIDGIDLEWMQLIMEAKNLGLQKEEIREFLHNNRAKEILLEA